jgi:hypothetical protein
LRGWCGMVWRREMGFRQMKVWGLKLSWGMLVGCCLFLDLGRVVVVLFREGSFVRRWVWMCLKEDWGPLMQVLEQDVQGWWHLDSVPARCRGFSDPPDILRLDRLGGLGHWRRLP